MLTTRSSLLLFLACSTSGAHGLVVSGSALHAPRRAVATPAHYRVPSPPLALLEVAPVSYNLALGSIALGAVFGVPGSPLKNRVTAFVPGALLFIFGLFIAFQTTTLRFTFDDNAFSLVKADLSSLGENVVVGGENKWAYDKFVNYDFFPSEGFPILVYFKETQTPADQWDVGPGEQANSAEALAKGAVRGQVHFFPAISDVQYLKDGFVKHGCKRLS